MSSLALLFFFSFFNAAAQTRPFIHTCTRSLNPVSWNKKAASPSWDFAEVHTFFQALAFFGRASASDESRAKVWTVTSRWVVNLPSSHHSFLPLVNRIKCSAWPQDVCQDIFWTEYQFEAVASKTCYVNVSRVTEMCWEENLNSQVLFGVWGRAREPRGGSGSVISPGWKTEKRRCVDLLWGLKSDTWLEWEGSLLHLHPGRSVGT